MTTSRKNHAKQARRRAVRRVTSLKFARRSGKLPRLLTSSITIKKVNGEVVMLFGDGLRGACRLDYQPGGSAACYGNCKAGKMCSMFVKQTKTGLKIKCKCVKIGEPPDDEPEVISPWDWEA